MPGQDAEPGRDLEPGRAAGLGSEAVPGSDAVPGRDLDLDALLAEAGAAPLTDAQSAQFATYLQLLLRWNARTNLTAIRDPQQIRRRHFLECILAARALPPEVRTLLDFGSGAGFPGVPIAICRPEIAVTLAESQHKKAAFLREVARSLPLPVAVHGGRAEELAEKVDCVALRAVDRMDEAVAAATRLVAAGGWLAVLTTEDQVEAVRAAAARGAELRGREVAARQADAADEPQQAGMDKSIYEINWAAALPLLSATRERLLLGQLVFAKYSL